MGIVSSEMHVHTSEAYDRVGNILYVESPHIENGTHEDERLLLFALLALASLTCTHRNMFLFPYPKATFIDPFYTHNFALPDSIFLSFSMCSHSSHRSVSGVD
ncbi:hypothetical protein HN51_042992 [Arachis hypogaea]